MKKSIRLYAYGIKMKKLETRNLKVELFFVTLQHE